MKGTIFKLAVVVSAAAVLITAVCWPTGNLGPTAKASCFSADHLSGSVGWRVDSDGMAVVFSGDTRFNPALIEASHGARLLVHEAYRTDEHLEYAARRGHSTAGDAGRSAAQAGVAELVLTHLDTPFSIDPQPLIDDAKKFYEGPVSAASDLQQITAVTP